MTTPTSRQEIRERLRTQATAIRSKIKDTYGDQVESIDFSYIELFTALFFQEMKHDPQKPAWPHRDRLVISNLRTIPSLLAVLMEAGYLSWKEFHELLTSLPKFFSTPNVSLSDYPGVEFITSSPYLGLIQSVGHSIAGRKSRQAYRVFHVLDDKRTAAIQDVLLAAADSRLQNMTSIVPFLELQRRAASMQFWFSMGWQLEEVRFDDAAVVYEGLYRASLAKGKPQVLLG